MPILGLEGAAPLEGFKSRREFAASAVKKRTLGDPGTFPPALLAGGGNGATYMAARVNRLTQDFIGRNVSADAETVRIQVIRRGRYDRKVPRRPFTRLL